MRTATLSAVALALSLPALGRAEPFNPDRVPADAKYVVHLDMDRVRDTKLWPAVDEKLRSDAGFARQVSEVGRMTDLKFPQDLHDVTVYGKAPGEAESVVLVHAHVDRNRVMTLLQMNPGYSSKPVANGRDVLTWDDKGKTQYGAFYDDANVVIGHDVAHVEDALAALDDKSKAVKAGDGVAAGVKAKQLFYVGVRDLQSLRSPGDSPVVQKVQGGWVAVDEADAAAGTSVVASARLDAKDEQSAKQLAGTLNGLVAMVGLMSAGPGDPAATQPGAAVGASLADALRSAAIKQSGTGVDVTWSVPLDQVKTLVEQMHAGSQGVKVEVKIDADQK